MNRVTFILAQDNGNRVELRIKELSEGMTQDVFAGTYLFPAMLRLIKGAGMIFDKELPVSMYLDIDGQDVHMIASVYVKSRATTAIRTAVIAFNEAIAALVTPSVPVSAYQLIDMKGDRGGEFRRYAKGLLRPSVSLAGAIANVN